MRNIKKVVCLLCLVMVITGCLTGCGSGGGISGIYVTEDSFEFDAVKFNTDGTFETEANYNVYERNEEWTHSYGHSGKYGKNGDKYELTYSSGDMYSKMFKYEMEIVSDGEVSIQQIYIDEGTIKERGERGKTATFKKSE